MNQVFSDYTKYVKYITKIKTIDISKKHEKKFNLYW